MYSRKENKMSRNNDSFDMDKWSKGRTKTERKGKDSSPKFKEKEFKIKDSTSFKIKGKKEKAFKEPKKFKEPKETGFDTDKKSVFKSPFNFKKNDVFKTFDNQSEKKKFKFDLKNKMTRTIFISVIAGIFVLACVIAATIGIVSNIEEQNNTPISISMGDFPKLQYYVTEDADYTGLSVAVKKQNGQIEYVQYSETNASDFKFSGFDSTRAFEDQIITVIYKGLSCSYHIVVKEIPKPKPTLVAITIDVMPKTEYKEGEWLDTDGGMLMKHYSDGSTERTVLVNNYISDGWDEAWEGGAGETGTATYTLTVKYKEDCSKTVKTTYDITITE